MDNQDRKESIKDFMDKLSKKVNEPMTGNTPGDKNKIGRRLSAPIGTVDKPLVDDLATAVHELDQMRFNVEEKAHQLYLEFLGAQRKYTEAWHKIEIATGLVGKKLEIDYQTRELREILE